MKIINKVDDTAAPLAKDAQPSQSDTLKRSITDEISLPLANDQSPTLPKKVRFQSNLKDSDFQLNEDIEIDQIKQLSHKCCGSGKEFHVAICTGDEAKLIQILTNLNDKDKLKILHDLCLEEELSGASVLRLALRSKQLFLIGVLIKQGVNPFQCSADGNTLIHDIVLDYNYAALKILLAHSLVDKQFIQFINQPYHGKFYEGYFALDIICIEASLQFKSFKQAISTSNRNISELIFRLIRKLILNYADSNLLSDENENVDNHLKKNNNKYSYECIWSLIARIAELHELKTMPILNTSSASKSFFPDIHASVDLVAQKWQSNGLLPETKPEISVNNDHNASSEAYSSHHFNKETEAEIAAQLFAFAYILPKKS